ncbi:MAG: hypothetical protein WC879_00035 [Melioribacteraceae bacterium]
MQKKCLVCNLPLINSYEDEARRIESLNCYKCGKFYITQEAANEILNNVRDDRKRANLSGWLSENQSTTINLKDVYRLLELPTPDVEEKIQKIMLSLAKNFPDPGATIPDYYHFVSRIIGERNAENFPGKIGLDENKTRGYLELFGKAWCKDIQEFGFLYHTIIISERKFIESIGPSRISPQGWTYINSLKTVNLESRSAFIAMKFSEERKTFCDMWIEPGIYGAGYKPVRIDKEPHNNLIDDEIIANIKRSKFMVADFTENNNGVYYEAGFARGLNIPVIPICEKLFFEHKDIQIHFDVNHYPFILYEEGKGEKLTKSLQLRIEATIGKGNYIKE